MHYLDVNGVDVPGGFIHVPALPEQVLEKRLPSMCLDLIVDGLEAVVTFISGNIYSLYKFYSEGLRRDAHLYS